MYFKRLLTATFALVLLAACAVAPWRNEVGREINLAFTLEKNLLVLQSATVDGKPGRFLLAPGQQRTVLDTAFAQSLGPRGRFALKLNERASLAFAPVLVDLHGLADGIIGADVWGSHALTIDYRSGLVTLQREGIHPELMTVVQFTAEPRVEVLVDGKTVSAIVDPASPETLILPRAGAAPTRESARVQIAETDFGMTDVLYRGDVTSARLGNRLLSRFLVTIDYGRMEVGLWRDPRTP